MQCTFSYHSTTRLVSNRDTYLWNPDELIYRDMSFLRYLLLDSIHLLYIQSTLISHKTISPLFKSQYFFGYEHLASSQEKLGLGRACILLFTVMMTRPHSSPLLLLPWNPLVRLLIMQVYPYLSLTPFFVPQHGWYNHKLKASTKKLALLGC